MISGLTYCLNLCVFLWYIFLILIKFFTRLLSPSSLGFPPKSSEFKTFPKNPMCCVLQDRCPTLLKFFKSYMWKRAHEFKKTRLQIIRIQVQNAQNYHFFHVCFGILDHIMGINFPNTKKKSKSKSKSPLH